MKKPQENIEKSGNSISIEKIDILSGTKKDIEEILLSIKDIYPDILIIWNWEIWDKAKAFLEKTDKIHEVWFKTTKKIILCSDAIARCMEDKRGDENYENSFFKKLIRSINTYYKKDSPLLIVRSSWQWDATGVWIYESDFVENNTELSTAIRNVYESNFTNSAKKYREKLGIKNDGMWIIIEPCIGDVYKSKRDNEYDRSEMEFFWPQLSGWYQKQESWTVEIWINGWLWWWVESRNFDKLKCKHEEWANLWQVMLNKYFDEEYLRIERQLDELRRFWVRIPKKTKEEFLQEIWVNPEEHINKWENISLKLQKRILSKVSMHGLSDYNKRPFDDVEVPEHIKNNIFKYPLWEFIKSIKDLEWNIGSSQYLEWVTKLDWEWKFDTYITQIADQIKNTLSVDLNRDSKCILEFHHNIAHSWIKTNIQEIVIVPNYPEYNGKRIYDDRYARGRNWLSLSEFMAETNSKNNNYLLVIDQRNIGWWWGLEFDWFSNATWIIEYWWYNSWHENPISSHYSWLMSKSDILFAYTENDISTIFSELFTIDNLSRREVKFLKIPNDKIITWVQDAKKWIWKLFLEDKEIPPKV